MATGADAIQTNDKVQAPANAEATAITSAGAAMSNKDSLAAINAMKVPDNTYGNLPLFHITENENPYGVLTKEQKQVVFKATMAGELAGDGHEKEEAKALHISPDSTQIQVDNALGKLINSEMPAFDASQQAMRTANGLEQKGHDKQLFSDMTSQDPKVAKAAAETYFDKVYGHATGQQLSDFRDEIDNSMHNSDVAREDLGISHKASDAFMDSLKNIFDSKAPGLTKDWREENPSFSNKVMTAVHNITGWNP